VRIGTNIGTSFGAAEDKGTRITHTLNTAPLVYPRFISNM
jgi:hypothetical protein